MLRDDAMDTSLATEYHRFDAKQHVIVREAACFVERQKLKENPRNNNIIRGCVYVTLTIYLYIYTHQIKIGIRLYIYIIDTV